MPSNAALPEAGIGDLSLWLDWQQGELADATAQLAVTGLVLAERRNQRGNGSSYDNLELTAKWSRTDIGWQLGLSNLSLSRNGRPWPDASRLDLEIGLGSNGPDLIELRADFLRLEDLSPLVSALPEHPLGDRWLELAPRGDLDDRGCAAVR